MNSGWHPKRRAPAPFLEITVSWSALFKIIIAAALVCLFVAIIPLLKLLVFAFIVSVTLWPLVALLQRWGASKRIGVITSAIVLAGLLGLFVIILIPEINAQGTALITKLPTFKRDLLQQIPETGLLHRATSQILGDASFSDPAPLLKQFSSWGGVALEGIASFLLSLVIAIYLLADGERIFLWLLAFVAPSQRQNVRTAGRQMMKIVGRYMSGQFIVSTLCGTYVFALLSCFHAPAAVVLAVWAALCDVFPFVGFFGWSIPSVAAAFTVSPATALGVAVLALGYHLIEAYFFAPKIYEKQLHLSTLTILVGFMAGMAVAGVVGAIAVLPLIASYSVVEKIWLKPYLEPDTVEKHDRLEEKVHKS
jgi:predicted PurR-regulated permease PerM